MGDVDGIRRQLVATLREPLDDHPGLGAADADRLACVLIGRDRYAAAVGVPPRGGLASLPPPFDSLSPPAEADELLDRLRGERDDTGPVGDAIGRGYEATLTADSRGSRGQFYTPPSMATALVRWALAGTDATHPRVLDPAVGTGTFLLAALRQLAERESEIDPATHLGRLIGVDVDAAAVHLTGLRLAAEAGVAAPTTNALHPTSFFDCRPTGAGTDRSGPLIEPVDAVVGNPPFVRAESLPAELEHYRRHLGAFETAGGSSLLDGVDALSRRADAYVYFVTHATRFLREGGRLAMVLPTKWLMSEYGRDLRSFLRKRYRVHAVVGFDARAFDEALVDTALLLAERDENAEADDPLELVRLSAAPALSDLREVTAPANGPGVATQSQRALTAEASLARYLEAPDELLSALEGPWFVRLDALAEVRRGTMTGANRCFFVDDETIDIFRIEDRFLRPAVKSLRSIDQPAFGARAVEQYLLDVGWYVAAVRDDHAGGDDLQAAVRAALRADGYVGLSAYLDHAEAEGWHEGRTCQDRSVWFDLGELRVPAAFVPKLLRERVFLVRNDADAVPSNAIDGIWPAPSVDTGALLAVLNSSAGTAAIEVTGRDEAGLLQLMTYETASLPTLDVTRCDATDRRRLAEAGAAYADRPTPETHRALDEAVDAAFDLPVSVTTMAQHAARLRRHRVAAGETVAVSGD